MSDALDATQLMLGPANMDSHRDGRERSQAPHSHQPSQLQFVGVMPQMPVASLSYNQALLPTNVVPSSATSSHGATSQALMGVLNLLQQNIGALQALVPLLASQNDVQQPVQALHQQLQPQQLMPVTSSAGVVSAITQLANATASIIPQLGASALQLQQQPLQQQQPTSALASPMHQPSLATQSQSLFRSPTSQQTRNLRTEQSLGTSKPSKQTSARLNVAGFNSSSGEGEDADDGIPGEADDQGDDLPEGSYDIIEMDPVEILAEHTHFCEICGKGFKRDANLRMHMRGHGDEYKTAAALARPDKDLIDQLESDGCKRPKRFSCPYIGCKRNKEHKRFVPLKTMLCVKNHYRRSHCPKMLTCSKCHNKRFSVVADLRTHEKHCGRDRWLCSCGTSFSRKDKLLGHLSLFVGHKAASPPNEEDASPTQKPLTHPYDAPANSTSGTGACNAPTSARDCVSSSLNLNHPTVEEEVEREVVVYEPERQVTIVGQPGQTEGGSDWGNGSAY